MSTSGNRVRVRMLTHMVGSPSFDVGDSVDVSIEVAQAWIARGIAELDAESAMAGIPETAMRPRARKR